MVHWRSPGGEWSRPAEQGSASRSGAGRGLTLEHPLSMHTKSAPFLSRADWTPCWVPQPPPKPGAHAGFLSEGPVRPRLPLPLVPTSWDTSTWSPPCPAFSWPGRPQSSSSPPAPGRVVAASSPWFPGFLIFPTLGAPSLFPRRGFLLPFLPEAACSSCLWAAWLFKVTVPRTLASSQEQTMSVHVLGEVSSLQRPGSRGRGPWLPNAQGPVSTMVWSLTCLEPSSPAGGVPEATLSPRSFCCSSPPGRLSLAGPAVSYPRAQAGALLRGLSPGWEQRLCLGRASLCARSEVCVDVCARVHAFFFFSSWGQLNWGHFSTRNSLLSLSKDWL